MRPRSGTPEGEERDNSRRELFAAWIAKFPFHFVAPRRPRSSWPPRESSACPRPYVGLYENPVEVWFRAKWRCKSSADAAAGSIVRFVYLAGSFPPLFSLRRKKSFNGTERKGGERRNTFHFSRGIPIAVPVQRAQPRSTDELCM